MRSLSTLTCPSTLAKRSRPFVATFPPPILLGLAPDRGRVGILELQPIKRSAAAVARSEPLRHDTLEAHFAGVAEYDVAGVSEVLVQAHPRQAPAEQTRQRGLARLERLAPEVRAV